jgi:cold shock CspA family protein
MQGRVKFFSTDKRYGFISIEDERGRELADFHFHAADVIGNAPPRKHDAVEFWLNVDPRRHNLVAVEVRAL